jgi:hypothetical protein
MKRDEDWQVGEKGVFGIVSMQRNGDERNSVKNTQMSVKLCHVIEYAKVGFSRFNGKNTPFRRERCDFGFVRVSNLPHIVNSDNTFNEVDVPKNSQTV